MAVLKFVKILQFLRFVKFKFTNYAYCSSHFDWQCILTYVHQLHILLLWQKFDMMNISVKIQNIQLKMSVGYHSAYNNVYLWTKNLTLYVHIKTAVQRTIIQEYGDWYTGSLWVGCYIWYSEEGPGRAKAHQAPPHCTKCNAQFTSNM